MEETGVPRGNHRPVESHWQTLSHNVVSSTPYHERDSKFTTLVVIGTDCTGSCKSKNHTITPMTAPEFAIEVVDVVVSNRYIVVHYNKLFLFNYSCTFCTALDSSYEFFGQNQLSTKQFTLPCPDVPLCKMLILEAAKLDRLLLFLRGLFLGLSDIVLEVNKSFNNALYVKYKTFKIF